MYEPLETMITTGDARIDRDGCLTSSGEYVAALYESYAADMEFAPEYDTDSLSLYAASAAEVIADDLWRRDVESTQAD
jgi:hypothetical protein